MLQIKKRSGKYNPKKKMDENLDKVLKNPWKIAERFQGYRIISDDSWLRRGQTFEQANRIMQRSILGTDPISGVPCVWVDDLKSDFGVHNSPTSRHDRKERTCN